MHPNTARTIGGRIGFVIQLIAIIVVEFFVLLISAGGDLANNLIFFLSAQANIYFLLLFALLLGQAYFFGRLAAVRILAQPDQYVKTGVMFALLTWIIPLVYIYLVYFIHEGKSASGAIMQPPTILMLVSSIVVWSVTVRRILEEIKKEEGK
ncbi:hypothetical protein [Chitinophaga sp. 212800010-3]|uniref:hypothetical protein n=1 Tax=unclassified Chitinophaga TaxID=2619133 RepID=UPI002DF6AF42|nr:hypothetical protein [Chitinophaga sp. 212800010-3]